MNYEKAVAVGGLKARGEVVLLRFNCGSLSVLLGFYWGFIGVSGILTLFGWQERGD